jgi:hypothetical protein
MWAEEGWLLKTRRLEHVSEEAASQELTAPVGGLFLFHTKAAPLEIGNANGELWQQCWLHCPERSELPFTQRSLCRKRQELLSLRVYKESRAWSSVLDA